jgi:archaellum biogenesis protein FlaJ (TadC family)
MIQIPNMLLVSHYDPNSRVFTFVNEDFDLGAMSKELSRIKGLADEWVKGMEDGRINPPFLP